MLRCPVFDFEQDEGVAPAERNGDGQARQERPMLRENPKGWPEPQRPTVRSERSSSGPKSGAEHVLLVASHIFSGVPLPIASPASKARWYWEVTMMGLVEVGVTMWAVLFDDGV